MSASVMAQEVEETGIPDGFVAIATKAEDLGDGLVLEKTLSVEESTSRVGFSGQRSTMVSHRYMFHGEEKLKITAVAAFSSVPGQNVCYLNETYYNQTNPGSPGWSFTDILPIEVDNYNPFLGNNYSEYEVEYRILTTVYHYTDKGKLSIKCTSSGDISDSGHDSTNNSLNNDAIVYDGMVYEFN